MASSSSAMGTRRARSPISEVSSKTASQATSGMVRDLSIHMKTTAEGAGCDVELRMRVHVPVSSAGTMLSLFQGNRYTFRSSSVIPLDSQSHAIPFDSPTYKRAQKGVAVVQPTTSDGEDYSSEDDSFPGHYRLEVAADIEPSPEMQPPNPDSAGKRGRRGSFSNRREAIYEVVIALWVLLDSRPPDTAYSVTLDIPNTMQNQLRLDLPSLPSSRLSWDVAAEPPLTRQPSAGGSGPSIAAIFPSSPTLSIRWAAFDKKASRTVRTEATMRQVKSTLVHTVLRQDGDRLVTQVDLDVTCTGIRTAGASFKPYLLVVPDLHGSEATWAQEGQGWIFRDVHGATICDAAQEVSPSTRPAVVRASGSGSGPQWTASRASLIRTAFPDPGNTAADVEFSFEETLGRSDGSTPLRTGGTASGRSSPTTPSTATRSSVSFIAPDHPPSHPIRLETHLSRLVNDRITFRMSGLLVLRCHHRRHDTAPLPVFRFPGAAAHTVDITVKSKDPANSDISVVMPDNDLVEIVNHRNSSRCTVALAPDPYRAETEGGAVVSAPSCIAILLGRSPRPSSRAPSPMLQPSATPAPMQAVAPVAEPMTDTLSTSTQPSEVSHPLASDEPASIPSMHVSITPLPPMLLPDSDPSTVLHRQYVRVVVPWPSQPGVSTQHIRSVEINVVRLVRKAQAQRIRQTAFQLIQASVSGRIARTTHRSVRDAMTPASALDEFVVVDLPDGMQHGELELIYLVTDHEDASRVDVKSYEKTFDVHVAWPRFSYTVGVVETCLSAPKGYSLSSIWSDSMFQTDPTELIQFQWPASQMHNLLISLERNPAMKSTWLPRLRTFAHVLEMIALISLLLFSMMVMSDPRLKQPLGGVRVVHATEPSDVCVTAPTPPEPLTSDGSWHSMFSELETALRTPLSSQPTSVSSQPTSVSSQPSSVSSHPSSISRPPPITDTIEVQERTAPRTEPEPATSDIPNGEALELKSDEEADASPLERLGEDSGRKHGASETWEEADPNDSSSPKKDVSTFNGLGALGEYFVEAITVMMQSPHVQAIPQTFKELWQTVCGWWNYRPVD